MKIRDLPRQQFLCRTIGLVFLAVTIVGIASGQSSPKLAVHRGHSGIALLVEDPSGARVPKAQARLLSWEGKELLTRTTNRIGRLRLSNLRPGFYAIEVSTHGFSDGHNCRETQSGKSQQPSSQI